MEEISGTTGVIRRVYMTLRSNRIITIFKILNIYILILFCINYLLKLKI